MWFSSFHSVPQLGHDHFLPNPFKFTDQHSSEHLTQCSLRYGQHCKINHKHKEKTVLQISCRRTVLWYRDRKPLQTDMWDGIIFITVLLLCSLNQKAAPSEDINVHGWMCKTQKLEQDYRYMHKLLCVYVYFWVATVM